MNCDALSTQKGIYDGFYQEDNIVQYSEIEKMDIEWIIPDEIKNNPRVIEAYLGDEVEL